MLAGVTGCVSAGVHGKWALRRGEGPTPIFHSDTAELSVIGRTGLSTTGIEVKRKLLGRRLPAGVAAVRERASISLGLLISSLTSGNIPPTTRL